VPNIIKIDPYNSELYRYKVGAFLKTVYTMCSYGIVFTADMINNSVMDSWMWSSYCVENRVVVLWKICLFDC